MIQLEARTALRWAAAVGFALQVLLSRQALADAGGGSVGGGTPTSAAPGATAPMAVAHVDLTRDQADQARNLKGEIMAPCCWHGTVDHHNSPIATQIGLQIEGWVAEGLTRDQIFAKLTQEHGERILARPRTAGFGLVFYVGPAVAVGAGFLGLRRWLRRNVHKDAVAASPNGSAPVQPADGWNARFEEQLKALD